MIVDAIKKEFEKALRRKWNKIYVFMDFHEVILVPDYEAETPKLEYYPFAKELLKLLSNRKDICLIAWTCSHPHQIDNYLKEMSKDGIKFDYINENPEVTTDKLYGYYEKKPYYNLLFDDKSGIIPSELPLIIKEFNNYCL